MFVKFQCAINRTVLLYRCIRQLQQEPDFASIHRPIWTIIHPQAPTHNISYNAQYTGKYFDINNIVKRFLYRKNVAFLPALLPKLNYSGRPIYLEVVIAAARRYCCVCRPIYVRICVCVCACLSVSVCVCLCMCVCACLSIRGFVYFYFRMCQNCSNFEKKKF